MLIGVNDLKKVVKYKKNIVGITKDNRLALLSGDTNKQSIGVYDDDILPKLHRTLKCVDIDTNEHVTLVVTTIGNLYGIGTGMHNLLQNYMLPDENTIYKTYKQLTFLNKKWLAVKLAPTFAVGITTDNMVNIWGSNVIITDYSKNKQEKKYEAGSSYNIYRLPIGDFDELIYNNKTKSISITVKGTPSPLYTITAK